MMKSWCTRGILYCSIAARTIGDACAHAKHSRSSNSIIAIFAPAGGFSMEVSLKAVAPLGGTAV